MTYQVNVYVDGKHETEWHPWWANFLERKAIEGWDFDDEKNLNLNEALKEHNAMDEAIVSGDDNSPYVIFDTEQDFLVFLLKFS